MSISDRTRKILWGRSGNRCAYCRRELVEEGTVFSGESVVGDEAHIIGEKPTASRGEFGVGRSDLDEYDNLILLCKVHHKLVDDQPETHTVEGLHEMKDRHERWVRETLGLLKKPRYWIMPYGRNPGFVGRAALLEEIRASLQGDGDSPRALALVQAIHGLGGVGKTQLALRYAHDHAEEYDAVFWVQADSPARLASDFAALFDAVDLPRMALGEKNDIGAQVRAVRAWLESPESGLWLLIFDNAEEPEALNAYLPTRHKGHVLITSRRLRWENASHSIEVREMDRADSIKLLTQRSGQSDPVADRLAEALGDLPLALAQAGGYLADSGLPMGQYLALFKERRAELLRRGPCPDDYQLTVFATLDLAMARIASPDAEEMLGLLVCLAPEPVTRGLIDAFFDDPLRSGDALMALRRHSLVRFGAGTVEIHRLVRAVGWDRMSPETQARQAERAVNMIESRFPQDPSEVKTWQECKAFYPHALECARLAEGAGVALCAAAELLDRAGAFAASRGRRDEAVEVLRRSLSIFRDLYGPDHPRIGPSALQFVRLLQEQGDLSKARAFYEHALQHLPPEAPYLPGILDSMGTLAQQEGNLKEAMEWFNRALQIKESPQGHGPRCLSTTLMNLGDLALETGDMAAARQYQEKALRAVESELGPDDVGVAPPLINLSDLCVREGQLDEARRLLDRALQVLVAAHGPDHPSVARAAYKYGLVAAKQRDPVTAYCGFYRAIEIQETLYGPDNLGVAEALYQLALIHPLDRLAEAQSLLLRARAIYAATHDGECPRIRAVDRALRKIEELQGKAND
jgi:tetratricopeptide (TPR) repeat protein